MKIKSNLACVALAFSLVCTSISSQAAIIWNWEADSTFKGTFTTDGNLTDGLAGNGNYVVTDFSFDSTTSSLDLSDFLGTVSDQDYIFNQPDLAFKWDGSIVTEFSRSSGLFTNGFTLFSEGFARHVLFGIDFFRIGTDNPSDPANNLFSSSDTPVLNVAILSEPSNPGSVSVSSPSTLVIFALALVGLGVRLFRK